MTRQITGTLTRGDGTPLAAAGLAFSSAQSTPPTLPARVSVIVTADDSGVYDVTLVTGRYRVTLLPDGPGSDRGATFLGLADVTPGPAIDLLTLIGAPGIDPSDVQHLIDEALGYIAQAEQARDDAQLAESGASGWADLSRDWATLLGAEVAPGEGYSARHHAQAAADSALAASGSASAASDSAGAASGSASAASDSAGDASDSATLAQAWATQATGEVVPGEGYSTLYHASQAASSALAASGSAMAASNSAGAAAGSASAASGFADAASGSALAASNSADDASDSADLAAAAFADFDRRYLGRHATPPTTDNAGQPLATGALYWDAPEAALRLWDGTAWVDATATDVRVLADQQLLAAITYAADIAAKGADQIIENRGTLGSTDRAELFALMLTELAEKVGVVARAVAGGAVNLRAGTAAIPSLTSAADATSGLYFPGAGALAWATAGLERMRATADGRIGIGTTSPSGLLDVADNRIRIRAPQTPAGATAAGNQGDIAWDSAYIYVCIAANTWRRAPLGAW